VVKARDAAVSVTTRRMDLNMDLSS